MYYNHISEKCNSSCNYASTCVTKISACVQQKENDEVYSLSGMRYGHSFYFYGTKGRERDDNVESACRTETTGLYWWQDLSFLQARTTC